MKVTMIGVSGCGKTAYMAALGQVLAGGGGHPSCFSILPNQGCNYQNENGTDIEEEIDNISEMLLQVGDFENIIAPLQSYQWPDPTTQTTLWAFEVQHNNATVAYFDWIDYRGGVLNDLFQRKMREQEIKEFLAHVIASNAVIIMADSFRITHYSNINEAQVNCGARIINKLFQVYNKAFPERELIYLIVLTKTDVLEEKWKSNSYKALLERAKQVFLPLIQISATNRKWVGGMLPVSAVGDNTVKRTVQQLDNHRNIITTKDEIIAFPTPCNVEHVLFFTLGHTLRQMKTFGNEKIDRFNQEINYLMSHSNYLQRIFAFLTNKQDLQSIIEELRKERDQDLAVLRQFETHIECLLDIAMQKIRKVDEI